MTIRRFYAPRSHFTGESILLDEGETRHLRDVLRLGSGDMIRVFDGEGREFECRIAQIGKRETNVLLVGEALPTAPESPLDLTLCAAILKSDKTDLAVQKCVELGVNAFVPMITGRTDVRPRDTVRRLERWRKIALEATKQCGRARLMKIEPVVGLFEALHSAANRKRHRVLFFSERQGGKLTITQRIDRATVFLGPEGGWDDEEIESAGNAGADVVTFGGRIMKADTAAIAITALLQHHYGDLN